MEYNLNFTEVGPEVAKIFEFHKIVDPKGRRGIIRASNY